MKRCAQCEERKPEGDFYRTKTGLFAYCRHCAQERTRQWRSDNPEKAREQKRRWDKTEKGKAGKARERERNREAYRERNREYERTHREGANERSRRWRQAHPDEQREHVKAWHDTRKGAFIELVDPLVVLERGDGECGICGEDVDPSSFDVDHIVPLSRGGLHNYENTQPAHVTCNRAKGNRVEVAA